MPGRGRTRLRWHVGSVLAALATVVSASGLGCVQRRMTIRSNPPGALVFVDDYEIGVTPVSTDFTYYGIRKIRLVKDGYETLTVMQPVRSPWYQIPPLDFVTDNFIPAEIRDERSFCYQLTPQRVVPTDELLSRAEELRRGVHPMVGTGGPLPGPGAATPPPGSPPYAPSGSPAPRPAPGSAPPGGGAAPSASPWSPPASGREAIPPGRPGVGGQPVRPLPPR